MTKNKKNKNKKIEETQNTEAVNSEETTNESEVKEQEEIKPEPTTEELLERLKSVEHVVMARALNKKGD